MKDDGFKIEANLEECDDVMVMMGVVKNINKLKKWCPPS
jgi:hypothetical protein